MTSEAAMLTPRTISRSSWYAQTHLLDVTNLTFTENAAAQQTTALKALGTYDSTNSSDSVVSPRASRVVNAALHHRLCAERDDSPAPVRRYPVPDSSMSAGLA
uniref:Uncharacterized protein n=1 Tax=Haptolina brevifila TaxID=156173 RepID=A0A7S2J493_9EUKA|mmetsp:Transcript_76365/g.151376  ORF Transcript_76365/g.151376 Transcript_76365/m.151376 type:complete len:103 (+) Transcript_76365:74-382(+)|eukprot:CAMPEP_0174710032 /NCGR_PEP_ID=MMETSP1094-20130205/11790_1 /TAXON_ID=156173 /ORGANISM="Chrysochromulina brevifilum, Strain UTEX LB 985" /LENGTH=102 /DNA_ID=CAMNT_0015908773 /DNA_START=62 /DNA_END=370 /DNA_ORIENTATION=-